MGTTNAYSNPSGDAEGDARDRGGGASSVLFERLRDVVGRSPVRRGPGAGKESSQAAAQPRLPGMEAC